MATSSTSVIPPTSSAAAAPSTSPSSGGGGGGGPTSSPLLFFVALGFGVVFTNLWYACYEGVSTTLRESLVSRKYLTIHS